jgi:hypothetical protein
MVQSQQVMFGFQMMGDCGAVTACDAIHCVLMPRHFMADTIECQRLVACRRPRGRVLSAVALAEQQRWEERSRLQQDFGFGEGLRLCSAEQQRAACCPSSIRFS